MCATVRYATRRASSSVSQVIPLRWAGTATSHRPRSVRCTGIATRPAGRPAGALFGGSARIVSLFPPGSWTALNRRPPERVDDRLDLPVAWRQHRNPRRRQHRDPQPPGIGISRSAQPRRAARTDRKPHVRSRSAPHRPPGLTVFTVCWDSRLGAMPSGYSSAVGNGEENSLTGTRARARHRGQCSIASQPPRGLMLNPHRGQFRNTELWALLAGSRVPIKAGAPVEPSQAAEPAPRRHHRGCAPPKLARRALAGFSAGYARDPGRAISGRGIASLLPGRAAGSCAPQRGHASPSAHSTTAGTADLQTGHRMRARSTTAPN